MPIITTDDEIRKVKFDDIDLDDDNIDNPYNSNLPELQRIQDQNKDISERRDMVILASTLLLKDTKTCYKNIKRKAKKIRDRIVKDNDYDTNIEDFISEIIRNLGRGLVNSVWEMGRENKDILDEFLYKFLNKQKRETEIKNKVKKLSFSMSKHKLILPEK